MPQSISVENVSKEYRLGALSHGTLSKDIQSWWSRLRGRQDPNQVISVGACRAHGERFWALRDISFAVEQGEVLGIIGRNGAGKSTLLKILSRVTSPTRGQLRARGRIASLLEVGTGFHPELTGRENVFLNGAILGMSRVEIRTKFDEIVDFSGVNEFIDTPVKRYSSGMYVRLAFAVAAHLEPEILVIDEVLAVGDLEFQQKCLGKMRDVSREGRTVLFVSHNMDAVRNLCSRGLWLDDGRIAFDGSAAEAVISYTKRFAAEIHDRASMVYPPDPERELQFLSVRLCDRDGVTSQVLSCDGEAVLDCVIKVNTSLEGSYIYSHIGNMDGMIVWTSDSYDMGVNPLEHLVPGMYRLKVKIPARTLGCGQYAWYLGAVNKIPHRQLHDLGYVCTMQMFDNTTMRGNQRNGFLSTAMPMELEPMEQGVEFA